MVSDEIQCPNITEQTTTGINVTEGFENVGTAKDWVEEAIQREATPKDLRKETQQEFCEKHGIDRTTYYRQMLRKDNKRKIVEIWLNEALNGGDEVLRALQQKAVKGDTKAIELYMKFVLELAENLDVKSGGQTIAIQIINSIADKHNINGSTNISTGLNSER